MVITWLCSRGYRISKLHIDEFDLENIPVIILLDLVSISHRLKKICLREGNEELNADSWIRFPCYLSQHTQDVQEIECLYLSSRCLVVAMTLFPNLTSVVWIQHRDDVWEEDLSDPNSIPTCPNIKSFNLSSAPSNLPPQVIAAIISACTSLTSLECPVDWLADGLDASDLSCPQLSHLSLNFFGDSPSGIYESILPWIADDNHAPTLRYLKLRHFACDQSLDLRIHALNTAMRKIIRQAKQLDLGIGIDAGRGDISSLFDPSSASASAIDLEQLNLETSDDDVDMIAKILKACRNAHELQLTGSADISQVMIKIADNCHQLVTLELQYEGMVDGSAMKSLLQLCPKLESLTIYAAYDVLAYESLALYGGNLTHLKLVISSQSSVSTTPPAFPSISPIFNATCSFKQHRKQPINAIIRMSSEPIYEYLGIESLAAFLSCFGIIKQLDISLVSLLGNADLHDIPTFHAHELHVHFPKIEGTVSEKVDMSRRYDDKFLSFMNSCRSIKKLSITWETETETSLTHNMPIHAASVITFASNCQHRNQPLSSISYPCGLNLDALKPCCLIFIWNHSCSCKYIPIL
jgi:hypothetical protein